MGGMAFLRKRSDLVIHAHRNGWDILTRHPGLGMDFQRLAAILAAARRRPVPDQRHRREILGAGRLLRRVVQGRDDADLRSALTVRLPVACSGQWGGQAPETYARTGRTLDMMYLCGGGIVSHPGGPAAGVRAVQQAWQATVDGIDLETYATTASRTEAVAGEIRRQFECSLIDGASPHENRHRSRQCRQAAARRDRAHLAGRNDVRSTT